MAFCGCGDWRGWRGRPVRWVDEVIALALESTPGAAKTAPADPATPAKPRTRKKPPAATDVVAH